VPPGAANRRSNELEADPVEIHADIVT
jgi:hypothetical protein